MVSPLRFFRIRLSIYKQMQVEEDMKFSRSLNIPILTRPCRPLTHTALNLQIYQRIIGVKAWCLSGDGLQQLLLDAFEQNRIKKNIYFRSL